MYLWWLSKLISLMVACLIQKGNEERLFLRCPDCRATATGSIFLGEIWIWVAWRKAISDRISIPDRVYRYKSVSPCSWTYTHGPYRIPSTPKRGQQCIQTSRVLQPNSGCWWGQCLQIDRQTNTDRVLNSGPEFSCLWLLPAQRGKPTDFHRPPGSTTSLETAWICFSI